MDAKKIGLAVAGVVAAGVLAAGGAAVANSSSTSSTTATGSTQTTQMQPPGQNSQSGSTPQSGSTSQNGQQGAPPGAQSGQSGQSGQGAPGGGSLGTEVTGDEATKVKDAVAAQNSSVTVDHVLKQTDGSYLALTMQNNQPVIYKVSSDLATVTEQQAPSGGMGGPAGGNGSSTGTPPQQPNATSTTN